MESKTSPPARIRKRVSYRDYAELVSVLLDQPTVGELVEWFYHKIDRKHGYGTETIADAAYESRQLFKKDYGSCKWRISLLPVDKKGKMKQFLV